MVTQWSWGFAVARRTNGRRATPFREAILEFPRMAVLNALTHRRFSGIIVDMDKIKQFRRIMPAPQGSFFLFGPRGVGKSTWLRENLPTATYINLLHEKTYQTYLADTDQFVLATNHLKPKSCVIVDEVQRLPHLLNEVHRLIEERGLIFALSGSSARKLRRQGVNLLAGRAIRRELFPLVPEELGDQFNIENMLRFGSLPLIQASSGDPEVLESYVQTYLKEEIQAEALVRNLQGFARFLPVAALFHGQVLNAAHLGRDAGVSRTSILGYLDILEDTLLAYRLNAFEGKLRVKEKSHPKLYWVDAGIVRAARKSFGPVVEEERGALFEGWLASLLKSYQSYRKLFTEWNYWAPTEGNNIEVDFLLWRDNDCIAIEAKSSKRARPESFKGLRAFRDGWKKGKVARSIVVYLGKEYLSQDGMEMIPLEQFLRELQEGRLFP